MTGIDLVDAEEVFAASTDLTVGIEEEFQILDPHTLDLVSELTRCCSGPRSGTSCCGRAFAAS